jgi:hypothetical protein
MSRLLPVTSCIIDYMVVKFRNNICPHSFYFIGGLRCRPIQKESLFAREITSNYSSAENLKKSLGVRLSRKMFSLVVQIIGSTYSTVNRVSGKGYKRRRTFSKS